MPFFPKKTPLVCTHSEAFKVHSLEHNVQIPVGSEHPGAFAYVRRHHIHEGVDLYGCPHDPVCLPVPMFCVGYMHFTGTKAQSPWWQDTYAMIAFLPSGHTLLLGEIAPMDPPPLPTPEPTPADFAPLVVAHAQQGSELPPWTPGWYPAGTCIGTLTPVLKHDKGRPMHMLHVEMYAQLQITSIGTWTSPEPPSHLIDPTPFLLHWAKLSPSEPL